MIIVPALDILQSIPVLAFLTFTMTMFLNLIPGSQLGAEFASIFLVFTAQAWNMAFSFYQSLRTVPTDLDEATRNFGFVGRGAGSWIRLELPFAIPGLVWNMMMSMSGAWFFVVASEAITVGNTSITLPGHRLVAGLGDTERQNLGAVAWGGGRHGGWSSCFTTSCSSAQSLPGPTSSASSRRRLAGGAEILGLRHPAHRTRLLACARPSVWCRTGRSARWRRSSGRSCLAAPEVKISARTNRVLDVGLDRRRRHRLRRSLALWNW